MTYNQLEQIAHAPLEVIDQIAEVAAKLYGQEWRELSMYTKDIWRSNVRHVEYADISNNVQQCAMKAKKLWLEDQEGQGQAIETPPVEKKSKNKKRGDE